MVAPSCLRCREIEAAIRRREKMLQMAMFSRTLISHRCSEQMGTPSGKDGDAQWKKGDVQWKRWGRPVEKMGTPSGKDGDAQWKKGDVQWNLMEMFYGRCSRISPANRALSCGRGTLAYVVHVLLNAFVCTTGRTNHGEVSRGGCANAVRPG